MRVQDIKDVARRTCGNVIYVKAETPLASFPFLTVLECKQSSCKSTNTAVDALSHSKRFLPGECASLGGFLVIQKFAYLFESTSQT